MIVTILPNKDNCSNSWNNKRIKKTGYIGFYNSITIQEFLGKNLQWSNGMQMKGLRTRYILFQIMMIVGISLSQSPVHGRLGRLVIDISVGDLNGDGRPDVAVGTAPETIYAINSTGSILWRSQVASSYVLTVKIADLNRDGLGEILAGSLDSNAYVVSQGIAMWTFTKPIASVLSIALGNLDGDEVPDVIIGSSDECCYAVAGATGDCLWVYRGHYYIVFNVIIADLNDDGRDDVVAASRDGIHAINGVTGESLWISRDPVPGIEAIVSINDLNKDGIDDVVVGSYTNVFILSGASGEIIWSQRGLRGLVSVVVEGDFNGDQVRDVGIGTTRGHIYAFEGSTGDSLWTHLEPESGEISKRVLSATVGEFNADGVDDILVGTLDSRTYVISGATGQLHWANPHFPSRVVQVAAADLNQDGICDALAASGPNVYALDGLTGKSLWNTIEFWEHVGNQFIVPVTSITIGLALLGLFILSWERRKKAQATGKVFNFWFGQEKLGISYVVNLAIISALSWSVQKDWLVADAATKIWLSFFATSFPLYASGFTIIAVMKPPEESKRLVKWLTFTVFLLFAAHLGVFLYGLPTKSSL